jgi:hypothetical protein
MSMVKPGIRRLPDVIHIGRQTHPKAGWTLRRSRGAGPYHISTCGKPGDGARDEVIALVETWAPR